MVIGGLHDGLKVTDIDDSAAHTVAVVELLESARAEGRDAQGADRPS